MAETRPIFTCVHCGNKAPFEERAQYTNTVSVGEQPYTDEFYTTWKILQCVSCFEVTVTETKSNTIDEDPDGGWKVKTEVLYPLTRPRVGQLPDKVQQAFEATLRVRYLDPSACAVLAGRTLEAICKEQKAEGQHLNDKLRELAKTGRIPQTLFDMAQQLKDIRNLAAHSDDGDEVTSDDVPLILDFLDAIMEYLYHAPAKLAAVRTRLAKNN
jgi:hypothetical protein